MNLLLILLPIKKLIASTILSLVALTTPVTDPITGQEKTYVCTAFMMNSAKGEALTAKHCIREGTLGDGIPIAVIRTNDSMALIHVPPMLKPPLKISVEHTEVGDSVVSLGYGWGDLHSFQRHVSTFVEPTEPTDESPWVCDKKMMVLDGPLAPGMSGGPIVNEWGEVVGINQASNNVIGIGCGAREMLDFMNRRK